MRDAKPVSEKTVKASTTMLASFFVSFALLCGCGGGRTITVTPIPVQQASAPTISTTAAQNGAVIVTLASTTSGATIYYTVDGSAPTAASQIYQAPFLVASNLTVKAIAQGSGGVPSSVTMQSFAPNISAGTLVWSDEFNVDGPPDSTKS